MHSVNQTAAYMMMFQLKRVRRDWSHAQAIKQLLNTVENIKVKEAW